VRRLVLAKGFVLLALAHGCGGLVADESLARTVIGTKLDDGGSPLPFEPPLQPIDTQEDGGASPFVRDAGCSVDAGIDAGIDAAASPACR
jgi:hypothetical protein